MLIGLRRGHVLRFRFEAIVPDPRVSSGPISPFGVSCEKINLFLVQYMARGGRPLTTASRVCGPIKPLVCPGARAGRTTPIPYGELWPPRAAGPCARLRKEAFRRGA